MADPITTGTATFPWRPDVSVFAVEDAVPDALILRATTVSAEVQGDEPSLRVGFIRDDDAQIVSEGHEFDESDPKLDEAVVKTVKVGQLVRMSREQYSQVRTPDQLANSVRRALTYRADKLLLDESESDDGPTGLAHSDDILKGDEVSDDLDALINLEAQVRDNRGFPDLWIVSPTGWAALQRLKDESESYRSLLGSGTETAERRMLGLPVIVNPDCPSNTGFLIDRDAIVSAASGVGVAVDSGGQFFSRDQVAVRGTFRLGHALARPERIGKFKISDVQDESE